MILIENRLFSSSDTLEILKMVGYKTGQGHYRCVSPVVVRKSLLLLLFLGNIWFLSVVGYLLAGCEKGVKKAETYQFVSLKRNINLCCYCCLRFFLLNVWF